MMKYWSICCVLLAGILVGCQPDKGKSSEDVKKEVIEIHDNIMPKSDVIMGLKQKISNQIQLLDTTQTEARDSLQHARKGLNEADDVMMEWMHQYNPVMVQESPEEEAKNYFEKEKRKIKRVKQQMNRSIDEAEQKLEKYGHKE